MFLKPTNSEIKVRDPESGLHLAIDGEEKPANSFWYRRLRDGDVVKAKPAKPEPTSTKKGGK